MRPCPTAGEAPTLSLLVPKSPCSAAQAGGAVLGAGTQRPAPGSAPRRPSPHPNAGACVRLLRVGPPTGACPLRRLLVSYSDPEEAGGKLAILEVASGKLQPVQTPYSMHGGISVHQGRLATVGGSPTKPSEVAVLDIASGSWETLKASLNLEVGHRWWQPHLLSSVRGAGACARARSAPCALPHCTCPARASAVRRPRLRAVCASLRPVSALPPMRGVGAAGPGRPLGARGGRVPHRGGQDGLHERVLAQEQGVPPGAAAPAADIAAAPSGLGTWCWP